MWHAIERYLPAFASAVVSGPDTTDYPISALGSPHTDAATQVVRLQLLAGVVLQPRGYRCCYNYR